MMKRLLMLAIAAGALITAVPAIASDNYRGYHRQHNYHNHGGHKYRGYHHDHYRHHYKHHHSHSYRPYIYGAAAGALLGGGWYAYNRYYTPPVTYVERIVEEPVYIEKPVYIDRIVETPAPEREVAPPVPLTGYNLNNTDTCIASVEKLYGAKKMTDAEYRSIMKRCYNAGSK